MKTVILIIAAILFSGCAVFGEPNFDILNVDIGDCKPGELSFVIDSKENMAAYQKRNCANGHERFCNIPPLEAWYMENDKVTGMSKTAYITANDRTFSNIKTQINIYCGWPTNDLVFRTDDVPTSSLVCPPGVLTIGFKTAKEITYLQDRECEGGDDRFCNGPVDGLSILFSLHPIVIAIPEIPVNILLHVCRVSVC